MIHKKVIFRVLGLLLIIESIFIFLSFLVSLIYQENDWLALLISTAATAITGGIMALLTKNPGKNLGKREGYIIVSLVWIIFSFFGSLPFVLSGAIPCFTDAFFETISGFTTTGASILNDIESLPHGILFWRSITQWIGGMGMIVLSLAILPMLGVGGMQLFIAEVPGPTADKIHPRVKETAKRLWGIYIIFTLAETIFLLFGDMDLFEAINHAFTTMATGGYSTKQASVTAYSAYSQYIIIIFMFIAGINFNLSYFALKGNPKKMWNNEEFKYYLGFVLGFSLLSFLVLWLQQERGIEKSLRDSMFQIVSLITTTGYATDDYLLWGNFGLMMAFIVMFFGGSAGSTGGGIKIIRIMLLIKNASLEFKRLVHPNAVVPLRVNQKAVKPEIITNIQAFVIFYIVMFVAGSAIMSFLGLDLDSSMGASIACLGNIGPGLGSVGPSANFYHIPALGKWVLSFLMLIGRLELFTVLILLTKAFWKK